MLERLVIKNFAIIDNTEIEFREKMTTLTGETGAGKTIIIDAISLLLGERASKEMIRYGTDKASIEGVFTYNNSLVDEALVNIGIEPEEELIIKRVITPTTSTIRVNGSTVTLNSLKQITSHLIDIHLQHDSVRFLEGDSYVSVIDRYAKDNELLKKYELLLENYRSSLANYKRILADASKLDQQIEFTKYQLEELENAKLEEVEYQDLKQREEKLKNFDKIYELVSEASEKLDEANIDSLYDLCELLESNDLISSELLEASQNIKNSYYELLEARSTIKNEYASMEYDPNELEFVENRLFDYEKLFKKYHVDLAGLIDLREDLKRQVNNFENYDQVVEDSLNELKEDFDNVYSIALQLTRVRKDASQKLKEELEGHLKDLSLTSIFEVEFNELKPTYLEDKFNATGIDEVDFLISTNKGEPIKSLKKTASGGELSRFMLALKVVLSSSEGLSTIIFDEIDTGVSGVVASQMAKKIKLISNSCQVLLITHLPQVAAISDHHIHVSKKIKDGRTISKTEYLDYEGRVKEIAKMLSGEEITNESVMQARQLLK